MLRIFSKEECPFSYKVAIYKSKKEITASRTIFQLINFILFTILCVNKNEYIIINNFKGKSVNPY